MGFKVRSTLCPTCIYKVGSEFAEGLENQCKDKAGFFQKYRVCHHTKDSCCRGFWNRHNNDFQLGQVAQRLKIVEFTDEDMYPELSSINELLVDEDGLEVELV